MLGDFPIFIGNTQHSELSVPFLIYASLLAYILILPQNIAIFNSFVILNITRNIIISVLFTLYIIATNVILIIKKHLILKLN